MDRERKRGGTRRAWAWLAALAWVAGAGCAAGAGKQVWTQKGWLPGSESDAIAAAAEKVLSREGKIAGKDEARGEVYGEVRGFAVSIRVEPGSAWAAVTCRANGVWSQGAAPGTWEIQPLKVEYAVEGYTPERCAEDLLDKIRDRL